MGDINSIFDVGARALNAQMVRMNTVASNLANAGSVSTTEAGAFRALRPIFETEYANQFTDNGLSTTNATEIVALDRQPARVFRPDHPSADSEGFVYEAAVNTDEEMVEMVEASRQYQNTLEAVSTLRALMARTVAMGN